MGLKMSSGAYVGTKGSVSSHQEFKSREALLKSDLNMPPKATEVIKTFVRKKLTNKYEDFKVTKQKDGSYIMASYIKGRTKGEHAVYVYHVGHRGGKINLYKDSYYADGTLKHRKFKIKNRRRLQK